MATAVMSSSATNQDTSRARRFIAWALFARIDRRPDRRSRLERLAGGEEHFLAKAPGDELHADRNAVGERRRHRKPRQAERGGGEDRHLCLEERRHCRIAFLVFVDWERPLP